RRLKRRTVSKALLASHPAGLRLYDLLLWQGCDLRTEPLTQRRAVLEAAQFGEGIDLSPLLDFAGWEDLAALRANPPVAVIEGVVNERRDSAVVSGRARRPWFKV